jgi:predicted adenine nucleotide alpha hydrolase (AANH) superfamily ATPase
LPDDLHEKKGGGAPKKSTCPGVLDEKRFSDMDWDKAYARMSPKFLLVHVCSAEEALNAGKCLERRFISPMPLYYFYNPNIQPLEEYCRHRDSLAFMVSQMDVFFRDGWDAVEWHFAHYGPKEFFRGVEGASSPKERCRLCYRMRLRRAAAYTKCFGLGCFTTTLLSSRRDDYRTVKEEGMRAAEEFKLEFLPMKFNSGRKTARRLAEKNGLCKATRCGCIYAEAETAGSHAFPPGLDPDPPEKCEEGG